MESKESYLTQKIKETSEAIYSIIEIARSKKAISIESQETLISAIDELYDIKEGKYDDIAFCISCGEEFEKEEETLLESEWPAKIIKEVAQYSQALNKEDWHYENAICPDCANYTKSTYL